VTSWAFNTRILTRAVHCRVKGASFAESRNDAPWGTVCTTANAKKSADDESIGHALVAGGRRHVSGRGVLSMDTKVMTMPFARLVLR
jgi:hypothetical protein